MAIKRQLHFVPLGDFLHNSTPRDYSSEGKITAEWKTLAGLSAAELQNADLIKLSEHPDADLRLLALLALVAKETPDFVPVCIRLMNDVSVTIPAWSSGFGGMEEIQTKPQTVQDVARRCLEMVGCSLTYEGGDKVGIKPDAESWWNLRKSNPDWLGWHEFLYKRASQGISPVQEEAKPAIKQFRTRVDELPRRTRAWALLYLANDVFSVNGRWQDWYATEKEMIDAAQELGAPALIEFLRTGGRAGLQQPAIDDPQKGTRFIITYAKHFFTAVNADDLLALKQYTAAMDADPSRARQIKDEAIDHFNSMRSDAWEQAKVMAALMDYGDETDRSVAVEWFYSAANSTDRSSAQSLFIHGLEQRRPREAMDVLRRLISYPAFDRLAPLNVIYTAMMLEKLVRDFSFDHTWRDDKADNLRSLLRAYFWIGFISHKELKLPEKILVQPEWSIELGGLGHSMVINPSGSLLAVGMSDKDGGVRVLDTENGKEKSLIAQSGRDLEVFFNHDGTKLLFDAPGNANQIRVWDVGSGGVSWQNVEPQSGFQLAADKPFGLFDGDNNNPRFFWVNLSKYKTLWTQDYQPKHARRMTVSPDARWIAMGDAGFKHIQLLDASQAELVAELTGHATYPSKFVFSPDSTKLISVGEDERVIIWDVIGRRMLSRFHGNRSQYGPVGFTADSQSFIVDVGDHNLAVYTMLGNPRFGIKFQGSWVTKVVPSRDGRFLYLMIQHTGSPTVGWPTNKSRIECWRLP